MIQVTLLAAVLLFLAAPGGTVTDQRKALRDLELRWLAVEDSPDDLESILADDFVHVLPVGFVSKREQIDFMRRHPAVRQVDKHFADLRVRVYGQVGVVNGVVVATDEKGKVTKTAFTDVFAWRDGRWRAVNAQELPMAAAR